MEQQRLTVQILLLTALHVGTVLVTPVKIVQAVLQIVAAVAALLLWTAQALRGVHKNVQVVVVTMIPLPVVMNQLINLGVNGSVTVCGATPELVAVVAVGTTNGVNACVGKIILDK